MIGQQRPPTRGKGVAVVTMGDVARAAGVSTALVSIVMRGVPGASDSTRERVRRIADDMGYVPDRRAQKLRQSSSRLLGVVFELQQPFHGDVVEHLYAAASRRGYDLMLSAVAPSRSEDDAVEAVLRERCESVVLLGSRLSPDALGRLGHRIPALVVARSSGIADIGSVRGDDIAGITQAVEHLVTLGHRAIAHIDGGDAPGAGDRRAGFLAATTARGLTSTSSVVRGGVSENAGAQAMAALLDAREAPTAVVAFNDRCAVGVLDVLVRRGHSVPGDISVIGYDDSSIATIDYVQLTTISQDAESMADAAVVGALDQVSGAGAGDVVLAPRLVRRSTTGPATTAQDRSRQKPMGNPA